MGPGAVSRLRFLLVLVVFVVIHRSLLPPLALFGANGDALVALTIAGALLGGAERGASLGFVAGIVSDLFLSTPFGLSALTLSVVGFAVGLLQEGIIRAAWWIPVATAFVAGVASTFLWAAAAAMVGQSGMFDTRLVVVAAVVGVYAALLCPVALRLLRWASTGAAAPRTFTVS